ncbi:RIP metalloprotease RseP [Marivibrio halodurans]|uniref:Zinc metalloprotease n=1 Tax=Marivibrio halodurans TaxID=2039722 RepID=A0A8J7V0V8_9PROT|nr:RIP metalloprotease RseP [Marivibrio halodurans]MBP5855461.1 RIP metalloprotease RseP [Marivibrio halodurans]
MDSFVGSVGYFNAIIVFCLLVFVHELGHYLVARWAGVRVETFSIGFGREIWGRTDKAGTRWKVSLIPLGGYVKMFGEGETLIERGESDGEERERPLTEAERAVSFAHKPLGKRAAVVAAGPVANFLFAIVILAGLYMVHGKPVPTDFQEQGVGSVREGSAADRAGFQPGDRILSVDGRPIETFEDLRQAVAESGGERLSFTIAREGERLTLNAAPEVRDSEAEEGGTGYLLGVTGPVARFERQGPFGALASGASETWRLTALTLSAIGEIFYGDRSVDDMGGPVKIVQLSNDVAQLGLLSLISFMAVLSINLGLLNLFPIPMLDGGHLAFYAVEAVRGRPIGERTQEVAFRIGLALLLALMIFITINDVLSLPI